MSDNDKCAHEYHKVQKDHDKHIHSDDCDHTVIEHDGHLDFVHDGKLCHPHEEGGKFLHMHECKLPVNDEFPADCTKEFRSVACEAHDDGEICGPKCGHEAVPHGDHMDYLVPVNGFLAELHCPDDDHCDYHGDVFYSKPSSSPSP